MWWGLERGGGGALGGASSRVLLYLTLHCHRQYGFCIKMDIDGNHCNVSLILRGKNTRQCPQTTICKEKGEQERRIEPYTVAMQRAREELKPRVLQSDQPAAKPMDDC